MIHLGNIATDIKQIDPVWSFSYYCGIPADQFDGSTIKIKSIFTEEKTPSLCIYVKNGQTRFKCFSSSYGGDHINLVQAKYNLNFSQSCHKIIGDYTTWILNHEKFTKGEYSEDNKYKVSNYIKRQWNTHDRDFWLSFGIGTTRLEWGYVSPLESYTMSKEGSEIVISGEYLYGYFTKSGDLYKIYQPKNRDCKFISVKEYNTGSEHDEDNRFCVILSSWKDAMCFKNFGLKIDIRVPSSENSLFPEPYVQDLKKKYKKVFTLLDADDAGKKAMLKYKELYDLDFVWLPLSKDISDSVKDYSKKEVLYKMLPLIHKVLN